MTERAGSHEFIVGDATSLPLEDESVHAIVTDPPYGIHFRNQSWDEFEPLEYQEWCEEWGNESLRVLKPGGHLLSFSGTRTFHRLISGIEDSGFQIRDCLCWLYGEGFPVDTGNSLKPAYEPISLARKPLQEDTIERQMSSTGTGNINTEDTMLMVDEKSGRYPPNVVIDSTVANLLDSRIGRSKSSLRTPTGKKDGIHGYGSTIGEDTTIRGFSDSGGPSRFFYTSKPRNDEKTAGGRIKNDHVAVKPIDLMEWLVKLISAEGQTVLDPFVGSGTTLIACENTHREGIGIDKNSEYLDISEKRVAAERGRLESNSIRDW